MEKIMIAKSNRLFVVVFLIISLSTLFSGISFAMGVKAVDSKLVGTWWGVAQTSGTIELRSNGTYLHNGKKGGKYTVKGDQVTFTGGLSAWNGGHATLKDNVIEFYWTNPDGSINWFTYSK